MMKTKEELLLLEDAQARYANLFDINEIGAERAKLVRAIYNMKQSHSIEPSSDAITTNQYSIIYDTLLSEAQDINAMLDVMKLLLPK